MRLDGLEAEKQLRRDLGIGPAVDDERSDLALTTRQRLESHTAGRRPAAAVDPVADPAQLLLGGVAVTPGAAGLEHRRRQLKLCGRRLAVARLDNRPARQHPRERR